MKALKKFFRFSIYFIIGLLIALAVLPFVFKDEIIEGVKEAADNSLDARLDFQDVSLSLFRSFPDLNVRIKDLTIDGQGDFEGTRLLQTDALDIGINLPSLWSDERPYEVNEIKLVRPSVKVLVLKNGKANYDISTSTDTSASSYQLLLEQYSIVEGNLSYVDHSSAMKVELSNLNHRGSGAFTEVVYDLDTETDIDQATIVMEGVPYLRKASVALDAGFKVDQSQQLYTLQENELRINKLVLRADGLIQQLANGMRLDLDVEAPQTAFSDVASVIPFLYDEMRYQGIDTDGTGSLKASIKGTYDGERERYPAINGLLTLSNGRLAYAETTHKLSDINVKATVNSTKSDLSDLSVDIDPLSLQIDDQPISGNIHITDALGKTKAKGQLKGVLDLNALNQALSNPDIKTMKGIVDADVAFDMDAEQVQEGNIEGSTIDGQIKAQGILVETADMQPLSIESINADFDNQTASVALQNGKMGDSDLSLDATMSNLTGYLVGDQKLVVSGSGRSQSVNLDEWVDESDTTTTAAEPIDLSMYQADLDYTADQLTYSPYEVKKLTAAISLDNDALTIKEGSAKIGESDLALRGQVSQLSDYLSNEGQLQGQVTMTSNRLVMRDFTTETEEANSDSEGVVPVPGDVAVRADFDIKEFVYDDMVMKALKGSLNVRDKAAEVTQATAQALGGQMAFTGSYDTKDINNPTYAFKYDMSKIGFSEAYNTLRPVEAFAPIMRYIEGFFNSTLVMEGKLNSNMMPDLGSIDASGFIETLNGRVSGLQPLDRLANKLSIQELKQLAIENTKNWITIEDGKLELKPQDFSFKGIDMVISGHHSLTTEMDYDIVMQVPREMLRQSGVGAVADQGLQLLEGQASRLGVDLSTGDYIDLIATLGGSITNPTLKIKPVGATDNPDLKSTLKEAATNKANEAVDSVKDSVNTAVKKARKVVKDSVNTVVNQAKDSARNVVNREVDKAKDKAKDQVKDIINDQAGEIVNDSVKQALEEKANEILGDDAKDEVDNIKDKLNKFNPFKK